MLPTSILSVSPIAAAGRVPFGGREGIDTLLVIPL